ncbi:hypothetical protein BDF20DRAFT_818334 [Mycotypha africana]|uniref:uncharacterized protein n=1 Tax=Mycotypha africana TaxID=64632 RepID=UPI002300E934|nr:uncharacterized protein BDF20DRAFT_818334 [Mycotypha africana]KAI8982186.1 hypothetical protein BDF20DRAFT_818334 [Mycotypha africana]
MCSQCQYTYRQFNSAQEELEYWRSRSENLEISLQETRAALDEYQVSSRELEEELEKELQATEKAYKDLKARCEHFKQDADDWKVGMLLFKSRSEKKYWNWTAKCVYPYRAATSSLTDLEMKLNKAIERNVILENEIQAKDNLTEQTQRLRDEINEMTQELSVLRNQTTKQSDYIGNLENKIDDLQKKNKQQAEALNKAQQEQHNRSSTPESGSRSISTSSNPVKMVQEMVSRVRNLESRLQSCRSLVTPLLNPPPSYSSSNYFLDRNTTMSTDEDMEHSSINTAATMRSGAPMHLSNINARRPSEYMRTSLDTNHD